MIINWGISEKLFVINISKTDGSMGIKYYFEVNQTKIIQSLIESYTNLIAGKSIADVQNITSEYYKRFAGLNTGRTRSGTNYSKKNE
jgi:hypothetical protein